MDIMNEAELVEYVRAVQEELQHYDLNKEIIRVVSSDEYLLQRLGKYCEGLKKCVKTVQGAVMRIRRDLLKNLLDDVVLISRTHRLAYYITLSEYPSCIEKPYRTAEEAWKLISPHMDEIEEIAFAQAAEVEKDYMYDDLFHTIIPYEVEDIIEAAVMYSPLPAVEAIRDRFAFELRKAIDDEFHYGETTDKTGVDYVRLDLNELLNSSRENDTEWEDEEWEVEEWEDADNTDD